MTTTWWTRGLYSHSVQFLIIFHRNSRLPAPESPTASGPDSERLPSPERERRQALEYEEEEVPPELAIEVKEAEVTFPNLPVPKSSDGDVSILHSFFRKHETVS